MNKIIIPTSQVPKGTVSVSGAKNSATRLMCAALLSEEQSILSNFPTKLIDVKSKISFFNNYGIETNFNDDSDQLTIITKNYKEPKESLSLYDIPVRTTYLLAAMQLLREGRAKVPYPGGCKLGERKYDLHIKVWESFGCTVSELKNYIYVEAVSGKLHPCIINFPLSTVGGTENALLCASIVNDKTVIHNAYISPEVFDLIQMLRQMGVSITLRGTSCIEIIGSNALKGVNYSIMPDRIEALTWLVYGVLSGGEIMIQNVPFSFMEIPLMYINAAGINFFRNDKNIFINRDCIDSFGIQPFEVACGTHPGVISDMQPFFVLLALKATGKSLIVDYRYPDRVAYLEELNKFIDIPIDFSQGKIFVDGPVSFKNSTAKSTDLRGSMAVILAGLLAQGYDQYSVIENPVLALRGYNKLLQKLQLLGINIEIE